MDNILSCSYRADAVLAYTGPVFPSRVLVQKKFHEKMLSKKKFFILIKTNFFRIKFIITSINLSCIYIKISSTGHISNSISTKLVFINVNSSFTYEKLVFKYTKSNFIVDKLILTCIN